MAEQLLCEVTDGITASVKYVTPGLGSGGREAGVFPVELDAAGGSSMTACLVGVVVSRTGEAGTWLPVLSVRQKDATRTVAFTHTITASAGATVRDALLTPDTTLWPFISMSYQTTGANMVSGDALRGYQEFGK